MPSPFTSRVVAIVAAIPAGRVTTYGIVARHAGNHRGARQVARVLHSSSAKYDLPWHRVIGASARISLPRGAGYETQRKLLEDEGVVFGENGRIDFSRFLWWPERQPGAAPAGGHAPRRKVRRR